jgi:hypothetical protein
MIPNLSIVPDRHQRDYEEEAHSDDLKEGLGVSR